MSEERKVGSIQMKGGKCTIQTDKGPEDFNLNFVCKRMRKAIVNTPHRFYNRKIREYINDLKNNGYSEIPTVISKLKTLSADNRKGVRDCCNAWIGWLNNIKMFKNVNAGGKKEKAPTRKFIDNWDKVFRSDAMDKVLIPAFWAFQKLTSEEKSNFPYRYRSV